MLVAVCDYSTARHADNPTTTRAEAVYSRCRAHYCLNLRESRATLVSRGDPHARATFGYDIHVSHARPLFRDVVRPLLRAILNPSGSAQTAVVLHGTHDALSTVLFGQSCATNSAGSHSSSSASSAACRPGASQTRHQGILMQTLHHLMHDTTPGLLESVGISAVQLCAPSVLQDVLGTDADQDAVDITRCTESDAERMQDGPCTRNSTKVGPRVVWDRGEECTAIVGAREVRARVTSTSPALPEACLRVLRRPAETGQWSGKERITIYSMTCVFAAASVPVNPDQTVSPTHQPKAQGSGLISNGSRAGVNRKRHGAHPSQSHSVQDNARSSGNAAGSKHTRRAVSPRPSTVIQFVAFPVEETEDSSGSATAMTRRGIKSSVSLPLTAFVSASASASAAASCRDTNEMVYVGEETPVTFLLQPILRGEQPGVWVSCFEPRAVPSANHASPNKSGHAGRTCLPSSLSFAEAYALARTARVVYGSRTHVTASLRRDGSTDLHDTTQHQRAASAAAAGACSLRSSARSSTGACETVQSQEAKHDDNRVEDDVDAKKTKRSATTVGRLHSEDAATAAAQMHTSNSKHRSARRATSGGKADMTSRSGSLSCERSPEEEEVRAMACAVTQLSREVTLCAARLKHGAEEAAAEDVKTHVNERDAFPATGAGATNVKAGAAGTGDEADPIRTNEETLTSAPPGNDAIIAGTCSRAAKSPATTRSDASSLLPLGNVASASVSRLPADRGSGGGMCGLLDIIQCQQDEIDDHVALAHRYRERVAQLESELELAARTHAAALTECESQRAVVQAALSSLQASQDSVQRAQEQQTALLRDVESRLAQTVQLLQSERSARSVAETECALLQSQLHTLEQRHASLQGKEVLHEERVAVLQRALDTFCHPVTTPRARSSTPHGTVPDRSPHANSSHDNPHDHRSDGHEDGVNDDQSVYRHAAAAPSARFCLHGTARDNAFVPLQPVRAADEPPRHSTSTPTREDGQGRPTRPAPLLSPSPAQPQQEQRQKPYHHHHHGLRWNGVVHETLHVSPCHSSSSSGEAKHRVGDENAIATPPRRRVWHDATLSASAERHTEEEEGRRREGSAFAKRILSTYDTVTNTKEHAHATQSTHKNKEKQRYHARHCSSNDNNEDTYRGQLLRSRWAQARVTHRHAKTFEEYMREEPRFRLSGSATPLPL